jgi:hypothetical protein
MNGHSWDSLRLLVVSGLVAGVVLVGGCRPHQEPVPMSEAQNLTDISALAVDFHSHHGFFPQNAEQLKTWAQQLNQQQLTRLGIQGSVEELFVSPRDHQPYEFFPIPRHVGYDSPLLAYEKTGVSGVRLVVGPSGTVEEMNEEKFQQQLKFAKELAAETPQ